MLDLSPSAYATFGTSLPRFSNSKPQEQTEFIDDLPFSAGSDLDLLDTLSAASSLEDDDEDNDDEDDDDNDDEGNDSLDDDVGSTRFSD